MVNQNTGQVVLTLQQWHVAVVLVAGVALFAAFLGLMGALPGLPGLLSRVIAGIAFVISILAIWGADWVAVKDPVLTVAQRAAVVNQQDWIQGLAVLAAGAALLAAIFAPGIVGWIFAGVAVALGILIAYATGHVGNLIGYETVVLDAAGCTAAVCSIGSMPPPKLGLFSFLPGGLGRFLQINAVVVSFFFAALSFGGAGIMLSLATKWNWNG